MEGYVPPRLASETKSTESWLNLGENDRTNKVPEKKNRVDDEKLRLEPVLLMPFRKSGKKRAYGL